MGEELFKRKQGEEEIWSEGFMWHELIGSVRMRMGAVDFRIVEESVIVFGSVVSCRKRQRQRE